MVWDDAEARTNRLAGQAFEALDEPERTEFVDLVEAASQITVPSMATAPSPG